MISASGDGCGASSGEIVVKSTQEELNAVLNGRRSFHHVIHKAVELRVRLESSTTRSTRVKGITTHQHRCADIEVMQFQKDSFKNFDWQFEVDRREHGRSDELVPSVFDATISEAIKARTRTEAWNGRSDKRLVRCASHVSSEMGREKYSRRRGDNTR